MPEWEDKVLHGTLEDGRYVTVKYSKDGGDALIALGHLPDIQVHQDHVHAWNQSNGRPPSHHDTRFSAKLFPDVKEEPSAVRDARNSYERARASAERELIYKAKGLLGTEPRRAAQEARLLQQSWREVGGSDNAADLEFKAAIDAVYQANRDAAAAHQAERDRKKKEWEERQAEKARKQNEWEAKQAERDRKKKEWEERQAEKARKQKEWEAEKARKQADYQARQAERERKKKEWEARQAERARKQQEWEARQAEKARKQAAYQAQQAAREAERARKQAEYQARQAARASRPKRPGGQAHSIFDPWGSRNQKKGWF